MEAEAAAAAGGARGAPHPKPRCSLASCMGSWECGACGKFGASEFHTPLEGGGSMAEATAICPAAKAEEAASDPISRAPLACGPKILGKIAEATAN